jgi:hypothetical protein
MSCTLELREIEDMAQSSWLPLVGNPTGEDEVGRKVVWLRNMSKNNSLNDINSKTISFKGEREEMEIQQRGWEGKCKRRKRQSEREEG